jgi:hypothetical protein
VAARIPRIGKRPKPKSMPGSRDRRRPGTDHQQRPLQVRHLAGRLRVGGRTYGTYMPEEGAEARSSSLEGLKDEAQGQARAACLQATGGHLSSSSWSYEYALGESTDSKLEAFRQARMAVWQAQRDREERGHQAAADLAAAHNATLPEIADILEVCCSAEAAELLSPGVPAWP